MSYLNPPSSLNNPHASTAAERRARADVNVSTTPDSSPTDPRQGFSTRYCRWLHVTIEIQDAGKGCDWELWCYDGVAGKWYLDTRVDTTTLATSDNDYPVYGSVIELAGTVERVYVKLDNATGAGWVNGVNVWLSGSRGE